MKISRTVLLFLLSTTFATLPADAAPQAPTSAGSQRVLPLDISNDGRRVSTAVGEQIDVTLIAGAKQYADPLLSSPAVRFDNVALRMPVTPGLHPQIYVFHAVAEGEALLQIPRDDSRGGFTITIYVTGPHTGQSTSARPDQANSAPWTQAWTNLLNDVQQSFTPSVSRLTSLEVELILANPGPPSANVTMTLLDADAKPLVTMWKSVSADDCAKVRFALPGGGLAVSSGQKHRIRLSSDSLFGWKYTVGGYQKGQAWFNGKPLLPGARSSFLFRTFGAS